jgi:hypothetical protein
VQDRKVTTAVTNAEHDPPESLRARQPGHAADIDAEETDDQRHGQEDRRDDGEHIEVAVGGLAEAAGDLLLQEAPALVEKIEIAPEGIEPGDGTVELGGVGLAAPVGKLAHDIAQFPALGIKVTPEAAHRRGPGPASAFLVEAASQDAILDIVDLIAQIVDQRLECRPDDQQMGEQAIGEPTGTGQHLAAETSTACSGWRRPLTTRPASATDDPDASGSRSNHDAGRPVCRDPDAQADADPPSAETPPPPPERTRLVSHSQA